MDFIIFRLSYGTLNSTIHRQTQHGLLIAWMKSGDSVHCIHGIQLYVNIFLNVFIFEQLLFIHP